MGLRETFSSKAQLGIEACSKMWLGMRAFFNGVSSHEQKARDFAAKGVKAGAAAEGRIIEAYVGRMRPEDNL